MMAYLTKSKFDIETHPWKPFIPKKADKLLLGTFPTHSRNRKTYEFFYPNPNNDFWEIIFKTAGLNPEDQQKMDPIKLRKQVLTQLGIGIADICHMIYRQRSSSNDNAIFPIEFTDIFLLLEKHPNITTLLVTSSSKNNSTLAWLHQYCYLNGSLFKIPDGKLPKTASFSFKRRTIAIKIIPSPSRLSRIKGNARLEMYKNALLKNHG